MNLNESQRNAATYSADKHVLVLAGAGTGKTRTIAARAAHLIASGVEARRIVLLTFTRRAAREMKARLERRCGPAAKALVAGTFHHFCLVTMRRMPRDFGLSGATVIDRDDQVQLMKLARAAFVPKKSQHFPQASELVSLYSYARNTDQPPRDYLERFTSHDPETVRTIVQVFESYEARKRGSRYLDFDDILHRFVEALSGNRGLRDRLRRLYDHILVDEMQDTNPLQWRIVDLLRDPAQLFCVGDDAQSIYAFRGADFRNVHSFVDRVENATVLRLQENYRSTQEILDLANWLLDQSRLKYDKRLRAHRGPGLKPRLLDFDSEFDEANWIAEDLLDRHGSRAPWKDHMVIVRTAFAGRILEGTFIEKEIPYRFVGGTQLLAAAHVKDVFSLLRCVQNHLDDLAWMRYLTLWPRIGDVTAARCIEKMRQEPSPENALDRLTAAIPKRSEIVDAVRKVGANREEPRRAVEEATRALKPLQAERYDRWENRKRDLDLLVRLSQRYRSLGSFLDRFAIDPVSSTDAARPGDDDVVTLITCHSAKGTEADVCYLIRVEPRMYPHARSLGDEDAEEEERRVLYVAMTRARNELILTRRYGYGDGLVFPDGSTGECSPSGTTYFLEEIPEPLVDRDCFGWE